MKILKGMALLLVLSGAALTVAFDRQTLPMWKVDAGRLYEIALQFRQASGRMNAQQKEAGRQSLRRRFDDLNVSFGITDEQSLSSEDVDAGALYGALFTLTRTQAEINALIADTLANGAVRNYN